MTTKEPTTERTHAPLAPSKLKNLELSPQWIPDPDAEEHPLTAAGTRMHKCLETWDDTELQEGEKELVEKCREFIDQFDGEKHEELKLDITKDCWGYCDLVFIEGNIATLIDYKFGMSLQEDAETNPAAQAYVVGIFNRWPNVETVEVSYLYPRLDLISSAIYRRKDVPKILLRIATIEARVKAGQCEPHVETCTYCGRKADCDYLHKFALPIATRYHEKHPDLAMPEKYDPSLISDPVTMSKAMAMAQVMERWADSVKFHALKLRQESGQDIPGYDYRTRAGKTRIVAPLIAWKTVEGQVTQEEFLEACEVSAKDLADAAAKKAERGNKKSVRESVLNALRDSGALEVGPEIYYLQRSK